MPRAINQGTKIYWDERGEGAPLLLIMGLGYSSDMWYRIEPMLSTRYRTIRFDNRGVGQSDAPPGPYTIPTMASDAAAVLDAAGVESAHVFGVSMGGMIAQEFALQYPARVRSLILACTSCGGAEAAPASAEVIGALYARAAMTPEDAARAMVRFIYDDSTPRELIEEDITVRLRAFPKAASYIAQLQGILAWGSYDRLHAIKAPTLVIHGETDLLVPPANGVMLEKAIPGAKLVMLAKASHILLTDQTLAVYEAVSSFIAGAASHLTVDQ